MIEFVIVLPLLLLLVFGMIEFGLIIYDQQVITNASREGARFGIVARPPDLRYTEAQIITEVQQYCGTHLISFGGNSGQPPTVQVTNVTGGGNSCSTVIGLQEDLRVRVTYAYTFLVFPGIFTRLFGGTSPNSFTLAGESLMKCE